MWRPPRWATLPPVTVRRLPAVLLLCYLVFLAYGSFFPFEFAYDPQALARFVAHPIPRRLSLPDVVANVLLGVPFGVLMVRSGLAGASPAARIARAADACDRLTMCDAVSAFVASRIAGG